MTPEFLLGPPLFVGGLACLVDTPLSLAGDIVTLPIAISRNRGDAWATWWGEQLAKPVPEQGVPRATFGEPVTASEVPLPRLGGIIPAPESP
jgi:hypothetical protein